MKTRVKIPNPAAVPDECCVTRFGTFAVADGTAVFLHLVGAPVTQQQAIWTARAEAAMYRQSAERLARWIEVAERRALEQQGFTHAMNKPLTEREHKIVDREYRKGVKSLKRLE